MDETNVTTMPSGQKKPHKLRNDLILIVALLVIFALGGLAFWLLRGDGNVVTVEVDGKLYATYSLSVDRVVELRTGESDENFNLLVIKDGKAYVEEANCRDGICAAHAPISRQGESIVCLPHKLVILVRLVESANSVDVSLH